MPELLLGEIGRVGQNPSMSDDDDTLPNVVKRESSSLLQPLRERLIHPFFGRFILSWAAWNWQALAVLVGSDEKMELRVKTVESILHGSTTAFGRYSSIGFIIGPILVAMFIPFAGRLCSACSEFWQDIAFIIEHAGPIERLRQNRKLYEKWDLVEAAKSPAEHKLDIEKSPAGYYRKVAGSNQPDPRSQ